MFEILMLLGFFYAGFCYLLPEQIGPAKPTAPKRNDNRLLKQATPLKPRKIKPHIAANDKHRPGMQSPLCKEHQANQRKLCKAGRLC
jgi:hypothetical protein